MASQEEQLVKLTSTLQASDETMAMVGAFILALQANSSWLAKVYEFREWQNRLQLVFNLNYS